MLQNLWDPEHPYYCSETNYYKNEPIKTYASWKSFYEEMGDSDEDMNLVFRWDWITAEKAEDWGEEGETLKLFFMGQRKGKFWCIKVRITPNDQEDARRWLQTRWITLLKMWAPISEYADV